MALRGMAAPRRRHRLGWASRPRRWSPLRAFRAARRTLIFILRVFPMIPSWPVDRITPRPLVESVRYPRHDGSAAGDLYRPPGPGPFPGIVICLGVVPFDVVHPQVARLGEALARSGFACLLHWSPAMRDFRLDPADTGDLALACGWLMAQPFIDPDRCGLFGTCVGGAFALMAAADPAVRDRLAFVGAYAPYFSVWTLARSIVTRTRTSDGGRIPWDVDPLTWKVFVHSITAGLPPGEADGLRSAADGAPPPADLSEAGRVVAALLAPLPLADADAALHRLPLATQAEFDAASPANHIAGIRAPVVTLAHDRDDPIVPVGESRSLVAALAGNRGLAYTELRFQHLDPGGLPVFRLIGQLWKFGRLMWRMFRAVEA